MNQPMQQQYSPYRDNFRSNFELNPLSTNSGEELTNSKKMSHTGSADMNKKGQSSVSGSHNAEYNVAANNFNQRDMFMIKEPLSANGDMRYHSNFKPQPYTRLDPRYLNPQYTQANRQMYASSVARISYKHISKQGSVSGSDREREVARPKNIAKITIKSKNACSCLNKDPTIELVLGCIQQSGSENTKKEEVDSQMEKNLVTNFCKSY